MKREDTLPWYRQFWPWFIIALPGSAVVAGLVTVWIAMQGNDSLVFQSSDGINVVTERNLAAERTATQGELGASLSIDTSSGAITASLTAGDDNLTAVDQITLELLHPTQYALDVEVVLIRALPNDEGEPTWAGHFVNVPSGRFYVVLSAGDDWRLSGEWSGETVTSLGSSADEPR